RACRGAAVRAARPGRDDHPLGDHGGHGLALDDRPRGRAVEDAVAAAERGGPCNSGPLAGRHTACGRWAQRHRQAAAVRAGRRAAVAAKGGGGLDSQSGLRVFYSIAGNDVSALLSALREVSEHRVAEVERLLRTWLAHRDDLEAVPAREVLVRAKKGLV